MAANTSDIDLERRARTRGGSALSPLRVAQFLLTLGLLVAAASCLIFAFADAKAWFAGWVLLIIGTVLPFINFRD